MSTPERKFEPNPPPGRPPTGGPESVPAGDVPKTGAAKQLTPEEQMAAFEEDLKENDWGHQPC